VPRLRGRGQRRGRSAGRGDALLCGDDHRARSGPARSRGRGAVAADFTQLGPALDAVLAVRPAAS
jgi:hypothetical protein